MNEEEARTWLEDQGVSRETIIRISGFIELLAEEASRQNLIASSTSEMIWSRHIVDSAQLMAHAPSGSWIDLGSGPGFPGLVIAALGRRVTLVESRAKRVAFLRLAAERLEVTERVEIFGGRVESLPPRAFDVISARAFAPLPRLLEVAAHLATPETCWVLPKGKSAERELAEIAGTWQGDFRIVPSVTDPEAAIIVAQGIRPGERR